MLPFVRPQLQELHAYTPHPGGAADGAHRLDTNESPYDLPADLKAKLAWTYQTLMEANRYPDGSHQTLKQAIATYVNEAANGAAGITEAWVSVGNGSDELIRSLLIATCIGGAGAILVATPTFSMYGILANTLGVEVVSVGRSPDTFEMDLEAAGEAIARQAPPIRVVFVVHPNSPTGNPLTAAELSWLRSLPEEILVVVDEAYVEFSQQTTLADLLERRNWAILRTFSKAFRLAAHRVGYALAHPEMAIALEKVRLPYNLPTFSQAAAQAALLHRQELFATIPQILHDREELILTLSQLPGLQVWSSAANFIYLRLRPEVPFSHADLCDRLKTEGTLVRHTGGGIRLTVGSSEENSRTLQQFAQILTSD